MLVRRVLASLLLASGWGSDVASQERGNRLPPPNIVLIVADDLGYGDLGSYGHPIIRTPRLDRLANEGIRLTSYYSVAPACTPARAALLTGRYPQRMGLGSVLMPESTNGIPDAEVTLAEAVAAVGFDTIAIGKWHVGHAQASQLPTGQGFRRWFGLPYSNDMVPPWVQTAVPLRLYRDRSPLDEPVDQAALTTRYTAEAVRAIREADPRRPFLMYLAHTMPHLPIAVSARGRGRSAAGPYGDVIEELDWSTGEILDALDAAGLRDRTIVAFVSDNGPWLGLPARMLQAGNEPWHAGSAGLLRGWKAQTWEGGVRVPAIVRWPGVVPAGRVSHEMTSALDLFATLVTAAGAPARPGPRALDGHDLRAHLAGTAPSPRRELLYVNGTTVEAVREGPWKLRSAGGSPPQLFHLELDPSERYDRAAAEPAIAARLLARLRAADVTSP